MRNALPSFALLCSAAIRCSWLFFAPLVLCPFVMCLYVLCCALRFSSVCSAWPWCALMCSSLVCSALEFGALLCPATPCCDELCCYELYCAVACSAMHSTVCLTIGQRWPAQLCLPYCAIVHGFALPLSLPLCGLFCWFQVCTTRCCSCCVVLSCVESCDAAYPSCVLLACYPQCSASCWACHCALFCYVVLCKPLPHCCRSNPPTSAHQNAKKVGSAMNAALEPTVK